MTLIQITQEHPAGDVVVTCEQVSEHFALQPGITQNEKLDDPAEQRASMRFDAHRWIVIHIPTGGALLPLCEHNDAGDDVSLPMPQVRAFAEWLETIGDWDTTDVDNLPEPTGDQLLLVQMFNDKPSTWPVPKPAPSGDPSSALADLLATIQAGDVDVEFAGAEGASEA